MRPLRSKDYLRTQSVYNISSKETSSSEYRCGMSFVTLAEMVLHELRLILTSE